MHAAAATVTAERVLTPEGWVGPAEVQMADGVVTAVVPCPGPAEVDVVAPGFVDLQVNGIDDVDVATADGADWNRLDALLLAQGTTTWCPTLVTNRLEAYAAPLTRIANAMLRRGTLRPEIAGVHLEGPFLGMAHGAHRSDLVCPVDLRWLAALPPHVVMVTIGAEQADAAAAAALLRDRGVLVSIGHTTAEDDELDRTAVAGATMVTHLFNAMSGLHHRQPGVAAWVLTHPTMAAGLIADGVHVHPRMVALAFTALGADRMVLVTDAVGWRARSAGPVHLELRDGAPRLADGTLAGSALTMDAAVRTCVAAGVPLEQALRAASTVPARLLGLADRGTIAPGQRADLVALDPHLQVAAVWVAGHQA
jgi:N-acetylglucosamine-6-phosphate deacetylase